MKLLLTIFAILMATTSEAKTQKYAEEMRYRRIERRIEATLTTIERLYHEEDDFLVALKNSQDEWEDYRESMLKALFPAEDKIKEYGSSYNLAKYQFLSKISQDRLEEIKIWLEGKDEGEVGLGSVKLKSELERIKENQAVDTTAENARLLHIETSKPTSPDVEASTEAAVVSP